MKILIFKYYIKNLLLQKNKKSIFVKKAKFNNENSTKDKYLKK